jgi:hypothetical protein
MSTNLINARQKKTMINTNYGVDYRSNQDCIYLICLSHAFILVTYDY